MRLLNEEDRLNVASLEHIKVIDKQAANTTYLVEFNFDLIATIEHNVTYAAMFIDTTISNSSLKAFIETINRNREDFASDSAYINYLNNITNHYTNINDIIELERAKPDKYVPVGLAFNPLNDIDVELLDQIRALGSNPLAGARANAASPPPRIGRELKMPTELKITRLTARPPKKGRKDTLSKNSSSSEDTSSRRTIRDTNIVSKNSISTPIRRNDVEIISRKNNMQHIKMKLEHNNIPFSKLFRENRHESLEDKFFGNIDRYHPPENPGNIPIIEQSEPDVTMEILNPRFTVINEPRQFRSIKRIFTIDDEDIPQGNFILKTVICSRVENKHPHQIMLDNVLHTELLHDFRINMPPPSVTGNAQPNGNALNIFYDDEHHYIGNIGAVEGYRILMKRATLDSDFIEVATIFIDDTRRSIRRALTLETPVQRRLLGRDEIGFEVPHSFSMQYMHQPIDNYMPITYRVLPVNSLRETNGVFTDIIIPPGKITPFDEQRLKALLTEIESDTYITATEGGSVSINVYRIPPGTTSVNIMRRNLSLKEASWTTTKTIRVVTRNNFTNIFVIDDDVVPLNIYEYTAALFDIAGNSYTLDSPPALIKTNIKNAEKNTKTKIIDFKADDNTVSFELKTEFADTSEKTSLVKTIRNAIANNNLKDVYEDTLKEEVFTDNIGTVPVYKISRFNVTTRTLEKSEFIESDHFEEDTSKLNPEHEYQYKVQTAIVDVQKLIEGIENPSLMATTKDNLKTLTGTIPAAVTEDTTTAEAVNEKKVLELSLDLTEEVESKKPKEIVMTIDNFVAKRQTNIVKMRWNFSHMNTVDFFSVERQIDDKPYESLGTTIETSFRDMLDKVILQSALRYKVTAVTKNGLLTESSSVVLK